MSIPLAEFIPDLDADNVPGDVLGQVRACLLDLVGVAAGGSGTRMDAAKRILGETIDELAKSARAGIPIVGIEPSCTGVLRSEALELLNNEASRDVAAATHTLAELLLNDAEWQAPDLTEISVAVAEQQLLPAVRASDASAVILADGFSCRTQLDDLSDRKGQHLAETLGGTTKPRS